ncbi:hypothetical protein BN2476_210006 [Paraburkholderia piptadeniae]|uniref:Uncharacterized protein n=1 Tax=Paraburkholderia piptadeniae TaxID=1701573 RepID=A0A1N7RV92_9BURK|nr:hypothetical protein BN2476_210006 [Paraburkholderia piptadeniae]
MEIVSPWTGDIHRVANAVRDQVSVSIHVYGGNIGRIERCVYSEATGQTKQFVSGYANADVYQRDILRLTTNVAKSWLDLNAGVRIVRAFDDSLPARNPAVTAFPVTQILK